MTKSIFTTDEYKSIQAGIICQMDILQCLIEEQIEETKRGNGGYAEVVSNTDNYFYFKDLSDRLTYTGSPFKEKEYKLMELALTMLVDMLVDGLEHSDTEAYTSAAALAKVQMCLQLGVGSK